MPYLLTHWITHVQWVVSENRDLSRRGVAWGSHTCLKDVRACPVVRVQCMYALINWWWLQVRPGFLELCIDVGMRALLSAWPLTIITPQLMSMADTVYLEERLWKVVEVDFLHPHRKLVVWWNVIECAFWCTGGRSKFLREWNRMVLLWACSGLAQLPVH